MRNNETTTAPPKEKQKQKTSRPGIPERGPNPGEKIKPKA